MKNAMGMILRILTIAVADQFIIINEGLRAESLVRQNRVKELIVLLILAVLIAIAFVISTKFFALDKVYLNSIISVILAANIAILISMVTTYGIPYMGFLVTIAYLVDTIVWMSKKNLNKKYK